MSVDLFDKYYRYFEDRYEVSLCPIDQKDKLLDFIDKHWKHNHALVLSQELLDWQHLDNERGVYTFSVATERKTGEIHAIHGYILSSQYDSSIDNPIRWGAIWKNLDDIGEPGLGIIVDQYIEKNVPAIISAGVGISRATITNARKYKYRIGAVERYYMINSGLREYHLADNIADSCVSGATVDANKRIQQLSLNDYLSLPDEVFRNAPFYKSKKYYVNRFFNHPVYRYEASVICDDTKPAAVLFWRKCEYQGSCCLRIVDYIGTGEEMAGCKDEFMNLIERHQAEFLDFMNVGIDPEYFAAGGFLNRRDSDIVLAHLFEPFVLENDDVYYCWGNQDIPVLIFKGDADLDRPNVI